MPLENQLKRMKENTRLKCYWQITRILICIQSPCRQHMERRENSGASEKKAELNWNLYIEIAEVPYE